MRIRKQDGTIITIGDRWYLRYWERKNVGGVLERKRVSRVLGAITTQGKRPPADIQEAAAEHMREVNRGVVPPERTLTLWDFAESIYLPWVKEYKRPSTYKGYTDIWECHLKPVTIRDRVCLKDVRTYTVQRWLNEIGKKGLGRNTLKHIQSVLSGMFTLAKQLGYYDGVNPLQDTAVNPRAAQPEETYAYPLEEVQLMLSVLPEPAATAFALAALAGLRHGEIQGLDWSDWHDGALWVSRSVWNGHVGEPKTKKSKAPVPVIKPLAERLEMHRLRCGNPETEPIFANSVGGRLNLNNLLARVVLPTLRRCAHCSLSRGKGHLKQGHEYERDSHLPAWRGWHAARRGLGSNLYRLGVSDKIIQQILRHSNVSVTLEYYVKTMNKDVRDAMTNLEESFEKETTAHALRDTDRTLKPTSGATPGSVN